MSRPRLPIVMFALLLISTSNILLIISICLNFATPFIARPVAAKTVQVAHKVTHRKPATEIDIAAVAVPNPTLSPGAIRTTDAHEICAKNFRTKPFRKTTPEMKKHVCTEYHVTDCPHEGKEELDHIVPLELGGLDSEANLWVQMAPEYHWKDALENRLRQLVCMQPTVELQNADLAQAQHEIMTNWPKAYLDYIGPLPTK
jgi:hypothetical protein